MPLRIMLRTVPPALALLLSLPASAAEWTYTDGAGTTVTLPEPPTRIIAHSTVAAALIPYGIRPIGILRDGPPSLDRTLDGVDVTGIPVVSRGWFEIDAEAVLNLNPDIIITEYALAEQIYQGGTNEDAISERLSAIAPIVGIPRSNSIVDILETYRDFAASLGADTDTDQLNAEKARFDASVETLKSALTEKPDLILAAASPGGSAISVAVPSYFGELNDWQGWGVRFYSPHVDPDSSYTTLSWENVTDIKADILLLDDRWESSALATIEANPIGKRHPAIIAHQTGDWPAEWIRNYAAYAAEIEELTALIQQSEKLAD